MRPAQYEDVRQFLYDAHRRFRRRRLGAMDRHVARQPDVFGLLPHDLGHKLTERRVADVTVQVRDLRWRQRLLDLVDTREQALQCVTGMEAGRPGVAEDMPLRETRTLRRVREFLSQEREVLGDVH